MSSIFGDLTNWNWTDGECLIIWMDVGGFEGGSCALSEVAGTQTEPCIGVVQRAVGHRQIYEGILYGRGVVFLAPRRSRRSPSVRRLLTVIGCYLGGCQSKRQSGALYASPVCQECQRSGALDVWSVRMGRVRIYGHWE